MLMGLVNFVNQKPLRTPSDAGSPLATLGYVYIPLDSILATARTPSTETTSGCFHDKVKRSGALQSRTQLMCSMGIMGIVSLAVPKMTIPAGAAAPAPVVSA